MKQITNGTIFIHGLGEVHRDLSPENGLPLRTLWTLLTTLVLFSTENRARKIANFGLTSEGTRIELSPPVMPEESDVIVPQRFFRSQADTKTKMVPGFVYCLNCPVEQRLPRVTTMFSSNSRTPETDQNHYLEAPTKVQESFWVFIFKIYSKLTQADAQPPGNWDTGSTKGWHPQNAIQ